MASWAFQIFFILYKAYSVGRSSPVLSYMNAVESLDMLTPLAANSYVCTRQFPSFPTGFRVVQSAQNITSRSGCSRPFLFAHYKPYRPECKTLRPGFFPQRTPGCCFSIVSPISRCLPEIPRLLHSLRWHQSHRFSCWTAILNLYLRSPHKRKTNRQS